MSRNLILEPHKQREVFEITNIRDGFDFIETYKKELSNRFIRRLHKTITKNILKFSELEGKYRKKGINVTMGNSTFKTVPGDFVEKEMKILIEEFENFNKKDKFGAIIRVYSGFIAIHPFLDGNGRTSRMLLNWLLMREDLPAINFVDREHGIHIRYLEDSRTGKGHSSLGQFILNRIKLNHWTRR